MLDIDEEELIIPDIEVESMITMPSNDFENEVDMMNIADHIHLTSTTEMLKMECKGDFASQKTYRKFNH